MKLALGILLLGNLLFASNGFEKEAEYTCLNTYTVDKGVKHEMDINKSKERPFIFTIKGSVLTTIDKVNFDYKMKKGPMESYSNEDYMLLLMPNLELGLVPKQAKGQLQYYFKCKD